MCPHSVAILAKPASVASTFASAAGGAGGAGAAGDATAGWSSKPSSGCLQNRFNGAHVEKLVTSLTDRLVAEACPAATRQGPVCV